VNDRKHIAHDAAALCALPPDSLERRAAEAHARGCPDCARALLDGARLLEQVDAKLDLPAPSPEALRRAKQRVRRLAALQLLVPAAGTPLFFAAAITALGGSRTDGAARWLGAAILAVASTLLCWLAVSERRVRFTVLATAAVSVAFAAAFGARGDLAPVLGIRCALIEFVPAITGFAVAALLTRATPTLLRDRWRAVALLATGGLTVQAALLVRCPARTGAAHVLLFHSGGLLALCVLFALIAPLFAPKTIAGRLG
jgi:hypothetical protein